MADETSSEAPAEEKAPADLPLQFKDRLLICVDCSKPFVFSGSEQDFFFERGLTEPKRCKHRRDERKRNRGKKLPAPSSCPMQVENLTPFHALYAGEEGGQADG